MPHATRTLRGVGRAAVVLLVACWAGTSRGGAKPADGMGAAAAPPLCPAHAPKLPAASRRSGRPADLVPAGAVIARLCDYLDDGTAPDGRPRRGTLLRGAEAAGLATLVDDSGPFSSTGRECPRYGAAGELAIFGYRHRRFARLVARRTRRR